MPNEESVDVVDAPSLERITVNLIRPASLGLKELMQSTGLSKTDVINRALQLYADLQKVLDGDGAVYVREGNRTEIERLRIY